MRSFVVIFVPCGFARNDIESAIRKHTESAEFVEAPEQVDAKPVEDAEHLPLWMWFTF